MNRRQLTRACGLHEIASIENLWAAAQAARRGKSRRPDVEEWWLRRESHILRLHEELSAGTWRPSGYRFFLIHEPKRREIAAAPFGVRVVHHALCRKMAPLLERRFIARSFSCQVGKGTTAARACCRALVNRHPYVLKCDVRKFFPSIDHELLLGKLAGTIRCPGVLALCAAILQSYRTEGGARAHGVPIGNLTSQLWGNFYLDGLDHALVEEERHGAYVRYTDDFLLFAPEKERLWALRERIVAELAALRLVLAEPKSRLLACREGVPFCGFLFSPGKAPRILGGTKRRFVARRHVLAKARDFRRLSIAVFSWYQFSREANSDGLRRAWSRGGAMVQGVPGNN